MLTRFKDNFSIISFPLNLYPRANIVSNHSLTINNVTLNSIIIGTHKILECKERC